MKKEQWNFWLEVNKHELGETTQYFLRDAVLHAVGRNEVTFILNNKEVTFTKLSATSWTMPSTLFVPYGSVSGVFTGLNVLLEENNIA